MAGKGFKSMNLQDAYLNQARKENVPITMHLVNGFQIKGEVKGFDNYTVVIDSMGKQQLVYKHAISTITPARPLGHPERREERSDAEGKAE